MRSFPKSFGICSENPQIPKLSKVLETRKLFARNRQSSIPYSLRDHHPPLSWENFFKQRVQRATRRRRALQLQGEATDTLVRLQAAATAAYYHSRQTKYRMLMLCLLYFFGSFSVMPERQYVPTHMRLSAHTLGSHFYQVEDMFRLSTPRILVLAPLLLPVSYPTSSRDRVSCVEGLCVVLRRLSFPSRWKDLVPMFGRSKGSLSRIFLTTMDLILSHHGHLCHRNIFEVAKPKKFWQSFENFV